MIANSNDFLSKNLYNETNTLNPSQLYSVSAINIVQIMSSYKQPLQY